MCEQQQVSRGRQVCYWVVYIFTRRLKLQFVCRQDEGQTVFTFSSCEDPTTNTAESSSICSSVTLKVISYLQPHTRRKHQFLLVLYDFTVDHLF